MMSKRRMTSCRRAHDSMLNGCRRPSGIRAHAHIMTSVTAPLLTHLHADGIELPCKLADIEHKLAVDLLHVGDAVGMPVGMLTLVALCHPTTQAGGSIQDPNMDEKWDEGTAGGGGGTCSF